MGATGTGTDSGCVSGVSGTSSTQAAPPQSHHAHGHGHGAKHMAENIMSQVDSDGSGDISQSEMEGFAQSNGGTTDQADSVFSALDSNSDGSLTTNEVTSGIKKLMETMQASMVGQAISTVSVSA